MIVALVANVLYWAVWLFTVAMWSRLVLDFIRSMRPDWRPGNVILVISGITFTITDPPMRFVRRFVKPVGVGGIALDFGWTVLMLAALLVMYGLEYLR
jgi:YggT family protein